MCVLLTVADVMCEELFSPLNGMIMVMGRTPGSRAMYSCDMGFKLDGEMSRLCQPDGLWSGEEPTCICESPQHPHAHE